MQLFASGLDQPRKIITAPNGDLFVVESHAGRVSVYRGMKSDGSFAQRETFASGLNRPFGLAFYPSGSDPKYLYVGNTGSVVRFAYQNGDLKARAKSETIVPNLPTGTLVSGTGHWTRDVVFSKDDSKMFVAVGSHSNVNDDSLEKRRADILEFTPEGKSEEIYASGIRNPVGLAIDPRTGDIWASVNERDELGDDLPPDYITHVAQGGFYGWPWFSHWCARRSAAHERASRSEVEGPGSGCFRFRRTRHLFASPSTRARNSLPNIAAIFLPPNMARGIATSAPATK